MTHLSLARLVCSVAAVTMATTFASVASAQSGTRNVVPVPATQAAPVIVSSGSQYAPSSALAPAYGVAPTSGYVPSTVYSTSGFNGQTRHHFAPIRNSLYRYGTRFTPLRRAYRPLWGGRRWSGSSCGGY